MRACDDAMRRLFLEELERTGNPTLACRAAKVSRRVIATLRQSEPDFAQAYDDAMSDAADLLEAEAWRRALEGVSRPVLKAGQPVIDPATGETMVVRRYSDPLLVMLLRGCKPEKFQIRASVSASVDPMAAIREIADDHDPLQVTSRSC